MRPVFRTVGMMLEGLDWGRGEGDGRGVLYLQIFRISWGGRVRWGGWDGGWEGEVRKMGGVVGPNGGLMRRLSAMLLARPCEQSMDVNLDQRLVVWMSNAKTLKSHRA